MSWVVFALLGVVAVAMGRTIALHQAEKRADATPTAGASGADAGAGASAGTEAAPATETCASGMRFCTMEFLPKTCAVTVAGKRYEASGNNGCEANGALLRVLCDAGVRALSAADAATVACAEAPIGESND